MNQFLKLWLGRKDSEARTGLAFRDMGKAITTPPTYLGFSKQGYQKNVMVYRCVSMIAQACAGIEIELFSSRNGTKPVEIENHELLTLLNKPNPLDSGCDLIEAQIAYYLLTGNSLMEMTQLQGNRKYSASKPIELWSVSPCDVKVIVGNRGYPRAYQLKTNDIEKVWEFDEVKLKSNLIHRKSFNPTELWWGQSPLQAAMLALDQSNEADVWNLALLQNSATPSGVLKVETTDANPTGSLSDEDYNNLKADLEANHMGAKNKGKPLILEGGLSWQQISLSPAEMNFLENKRITSADIANVFGVPLELVGLGQKTFNNYAEARCAFYEDTVLPQLDSFFNRLNNTLTPLYGDNLRLGYNKDDIEALAVKRQAKFAIVKDASFLTFNEKREAVGYAPVDGFDVFQVGLQFITSPDDMTPPVDPNANPDGQPDDPKNPDATKKPATDPKKDPPPEKEAEKMIQLAEWKSFNLLNSAERTNSWRKQNARRDKLTTQFEREAKSDFKDLSNHLRTVLKKGGSKQIIEIRAQEAIDKFQEALTVTVSKNIRRTVDAFAFNIFNGAKDAGLITHEKKNSRNFEHWADSFVTKRTGDAITSIDGTTKKQVSRIVKEVVSDALESGNSNADVVDELMDNFDGISISRAYTIARTEVAMASTNANLNAARDLEIPNLQKEWVSTDDGRVRDGGHDGNGADHKSMNGIQVPVDDVFSVPPDASMDGPGDGSASGDQVINCRCVLVFAAR